MSFLQQPFAPSPAFGSTRKRKDRFEDADAQGTDASSSDDCMSADMMSQHSGSAERRKFVYRGSSASSQMATFLPLGAEENVKMLISLGLLAADSNLAGNASDATSSANSSPASRTTNLETSYFPSGHYPNVAPYAASLALAQAREADGMQVDPSPAQHGPQCMALPQLYVSRECGSALYARCPDCNFSWEVRSDDGRGQTLTYSP
ncbi:unnamed protein product [Parajaminaea phylloscopi]